MDNIVKCIKNKGRISKTELAIECNKLVRINPN